MDERTPPLPAQSRHSLLVAVVIGAVAYPFVLAFYRLYLSPIRNIPGPKLSIATGWVETWYDVFKGGQFTFQIEKWHAQYGPIIRINPWEVHIYDPDFYEELYGNMKTDKDPKIRYRLGLPLSTFDLPAYQEHHRRRKAIGPFFSRQRSLQFGAEVQEKVDKLCDILETDYAKSGKVANLTEAFGAFTADVMTYYAMALSFNFLEYPDFVAPYTSAVRKLAQSVHLSAHFPWFLSLMQSIPESYVQKINPDMAAIFDFQKEVRSQIPKIMSGENDGHKNASHRTVFHELLQSDLSKKQLTVEMLQQEALSVVGGGIETTKTAMCVIVYHVLANPPVRSRLADELHAAIPNPAVIPPEPELEKLPYLAAVVQEGLRLAYGLPQRSARINHTECVKFGGHVIPPGVPVAMSLYLQLRDPRIFADPHVFRPERWLPVPAPDADGGVQPPRALNGKPLSKYLSPFSKGPRWCLGMNLAIVEIYITMATMFRRLESMELFETGRESVEMAAEYLACVPSDASPGVRVVLE